MLIGVLPYSVYYQVTTTRRCSRKSARHSRSAAMGLVALTTRMKVRDLHRCLSCRKVLLRPALFRAAPALGARSVGWPGASGFS